MMYFLVGPTAVRARAALGAQREPAAALAAAASRLFWPQILCLSMLCVFELYVFCFCVLFAELID